MPIEKRRYKRYPISGKILFQTASIKATGELVDIAMGGALIRSEAVPSFGSEVTACFVVRDYPGEFDARGYVVRILTNAWAIEFLEEPPWLKDMVRWRSELAKKEVVSPIRFSRHLRKIPYTPRFFSHP